MGFSLLGTCVRVDVACWSARAYGCFEVGPPMGLSMFSRGVGGHCGSFSLYSGFHCSSWWPESGLCPIICTVECGH